MQSVRDAINFLVQENAQNFPQLLPSDPTHNKIQRNAWHMCWSFRTANGEARVQLLSLHAETLWQRLRAHITHQTASTFFPQVPHKGQSDEIGLSLCQTFSQTCHVKRHPHSFITYHTTKLTGTTNTFVVESNVIADITHQMACTLCPPLQSTQERDDFCDGVE